MTRLEKKKPGRWVTLVKLRAAVEACGWCVYGGGGGGGWGVSEWWSRDLTVVIGAVVEREDHAVGARLEAEVERHRCVHHHHGLVGRHFQA